MNNQSTLDGVLTVPPKYVNIYKWLEWIIMSGLPLSFVESEFARKYSNLNGISRNTLTKYMTAVKENVFTKIISILPDIFALIFDGWSDGIGGHYVGVFASFNEGKVVKKVLLALKPLIDDTVFTAREYELFILDILCKYQKSINNVICIIGDNCNTNTSTAKLLNRPLVGCASHRLSVFVKNDVYKDNESKAKKMGVNNANNVDEAVTIIEEIVNDEENNNGEVDAIEDDTIENNTDVSIDINHLKEKVHCVMKKLKTLKNCAKLKKKTHLKSMINNATRWLSTYNMLKR